MITDAEKYDQSVADEIVSFFKEYGLTDNGVDSDDSSDYAINAYRALANAGFDPNRLATMLVKTLNGEDWAPPDYTYLPIQVLKSEPSNFL